MKYLIPSVYTLQVRLARVNLLDLNKWFMLHINRYNAVPKTRLFGNKGNME